MKKEIQYLQRQEIDNKRWDECIGGSGNGVVYAFSFYLDAMATNWDALVLQDYEAVMPLPWRKKWGIAYIYQPFLTAQLGIFGNNISPLLEEEFIKAIPAKFKLWEFSFNTGNSLKSNPLIQIRKNYILPLSHSYLHLYKNYRAQIKRNIKKAALQPLIIKQNIPVNSVMEQAQKNTPVKKKELKYWQRFAEVYAMMHEKKEAITYGVYFDDTLLASAVFLFSHNRAYYILVGNSPAGRTVGASHYLIDAFIKNNAGSNCVLDFEGSDIESLAFFYSGFGALEEHYPAIAYNGLPFYLRWLKK